MNLTKFIYNLTNFFFLFLFLSFPGYGQLKITDGDTIVLQGEKIRLDGIDSPEKKQTCLFNKEPWACGQEATKALKNLLENADLGSVSCEGDTRDRYGRLIGTCFYNKRNINEWMVENGWALAYRYYSKRYVVNEDRAKENKRGIWRGEFVLPWEWRKGSRLKKETVTTDCSIKGNISSSGERIYHVPGGAYYSRTKITKSKGERYFCTEDEARNSGWRRSKR